MHVLWQLMEMSWTRLRHAPPPEHNHNNISDRLGTLKLWWGFPLTHTPFCLIFKTFQHYVMTVSILSNKSLCCSVNSKTKLGSFLFTKCCCSILNWLPLTNEGEIDLIISILDVNNRKNSKSYYNLYRIRFKSSELCAMKWKCVDFCNWHIQHSLLLIMLSPQFNYNIQIKHIVKSESKINLTMMIFRNSGVKKYSWSSN